MKHLVRIIGTAVLLSLFGTAAPAYAQEEHQEQAKPKQNEHQKQQQAKPRQHAQQKQDAQQAQRGQQQAQHAQRGQQQAQRGQPDRSQHGPYASSSRQSGRYDGDRSRRIPDDRFRGHFGRDHSFRIDRGYVVAGGYSRFQYGGFWFGMYDPWPADWYYTDDIYVDYLDGGYYLLSPQHPGVQISISVVL